MNRTIRRIGATLFFAAVFVAGVQIPHASPVRPGSTDTITDRKGFVPYQKHLPLAGKVVGVLAADAAPVLALEGRSGPAEQLCFGSGGASYRWVYVPAEKNPTVGRLMIPVGAQGQRKLFENVSIASSAAVKRFGVTVPFALVEVEVNSSEGSPATDAFVATNMRRLDGSAEYPLKVEEVITDLRKRYADFLAEKASAIDGSVNEAIKMPLGTRKLTGPREKIDLMFVTWLPEKERLRVHFRTTYLDGEYRYANDIRIDLPRTARAVPNVPVTTTAPTRASEGFRYGTQFRTELGVAYEVGKTGKIINTLILPVETTTRELSPAPGLNGPARTAATRTIAVETKPKETRKAP